MVNLVHSGACSVFAMSKTVCGDVKAGDLSDSDCVRNDGTELTIDLEEIVPDSDDDEEMGRQEALSRAPVLSISRLQAYKRKGMESTLLENQGPTIDLLATEDEEHEIVPDSEEECEEGKGRVLIDREGITSNRNEISDCQNGSQQPGESSQADALKFIDHFLNRNGFDLSSEDKSRRLMPPPKLRSNGVKILAQKISDRTPATSFGSYNWTDRETNKRCRPVNSSYVLFYSRRRRRCSSNKPVITTMTYKEGNLCGESRNLEKNQEVADLSNETNCEFQTCKTLITGSEEVSSLPKATKYIMDNVEKDSDVQTHSKQLDSRTYEEVGNENIDDVFNTQMAAEVMETLSFEPPLNCSSCIPESFQTIISDYPKGFMEKEAKLWNPSLESGSCSGLRQGGDRLKHKKTINGNTSVTLPSQDCAVKRGTHVFRRKDKLCSENTASGLLFRKNVVERKGNKAPRKCIREVPEEPNRISLDAEACGSLSKGGPDPKFSTSLNPLSRMSKVQLSSRQKPKDGTKDSVHAYKRRRSIMVRNKNTSPNVTFDLAEVENIIESRKEVKDLSIVAPFSCIDISTLTFPKGQRTRRGSSSLRHFDNFGYAWTEFDTEKEVRCPSAKRYKPANHYAEPAWLKFSKKRRTSAACNRQSKGVDSCRTKASMRFSSDCNKSRSCVGDGRKNAIFDDSSTFYGFNSLTSVSSNSSIVPPVNADCCEKSYPKKMPKSSLIRELLQLEFSDVPLDYSCKNLRRRKHLANARVLLSQHLDRATITQLKRVLARLGISIAESASDATHFVTNTFSRTKNMLEAIALGIPVVTELWLENCAEAGCLVDEKSYILEDAKKEKEIGFSLSASLAKAVRYPLMKDRIVFITPNTKPDKGMLISLVKMVCGEVVEIKITQSNQIPEGLIVLSCEEDYAICMPFLDKGIPVYQSELLLNGIVTQKLELQRHRLFSM